MALSEEIFKLERLADIQKQIDQLAETISFSYDRDPMLVGHLRFLREACILLRWLPLSLLVEQYRRARADISSHEMAVTDLKGNTYKPDIKDIKTALDEQYQITNRRRQERMLGFMLEGYVTHHADTFV